MKPIHNNTTKKQKHSEMKAGSLIIVGPMPFPRSALKDFILEADTQLIFIDGGDAHSAKFKIAAPKLYKKSIRAGDGDSSKKKMNLKKTSQNISDLAFVLSTLKKNQNLKRCLLVGFMGGRLDHQLFNLGEIAHFLKQYSKLSAPLIQMDNKIFFVGTGIHHALIKGRFSIASFETGKVKISGECEYVSKKWLTLPALSSRGVRNVGFGNITIETQKPLAIIKS